MEKLIQKLIKICDERNYNFNIQYYDGDVNIYVSDNGHQIEKDVTSTGGNETLKDALDNILNQLGK